MLTGTKKLFPTDYKDFTEAMIEAAEEDELPVALQLDNLNDIALKDIQDMFYDFKKDTSLDITGALFICEDCGQLHLLVEITQPKLDKNRILQ